MREVSARLKAIHVRQHNNIAQQAGMHGIKIDFIQDENTPVDVEFSKEQDALLSRGLTEAKARKQKEYGR